MKWMIFLLLMAGCNNSTSLKKTDQVTDTAAASINCDGPDQPVDCCFENMPGPLTKVMQIGTVGSGDPLIISGQLLHADGITPFANVILYAYHTDSSGKYTKKGDEQGIQKWHGHLHGWAQTDDSGSYEIRTIRPASYPNSTIPAHIHAAYKEPSGAVGYVSDFVFKDDPFVTGQYLQSIKKWNYPGGSGVLELKKQNGIWTGKRDIVLPH